METENLSQRSRLRLVNKAEKIIKLRIVNGELKIVLILHFQFSILHFQFTAAQDFSILRNRAKDL